MNNSKDSSTLLDWRDIDTNMPSFAHTNSGFTLAKRGTITLQNGSRVFVKIAQDTQTQKWIEKEIDVYGFLVSSNFSHIPKLLSVREDKRAFALEYLDANHSWNWDNTWGDLRLTKTLEAMDDLAKIDTANIPDSVNTVRMLNTINNPWQHFIDNKDTHSKLISTLISQGHHRIADDIANIPHIMESFIFDFPEDTLVHSDVRSDNCAWNPICAEVKLIDWNWLQLGNRAIDVNSLLVSVVRSGFDVPAHALHRLDRNALMWLSGMWFRASVQSAQKSTSESKQLRKYQFDSAVAAYDLANLS